MKESYKALLEVAARYEVEQLQNSGQEFILSKETFNPLNSDECFYGQVFGSASSDTAMGFKRKNNILVGFGFQHDLALDPEGGSKSYRVKRP